MGRKSLLRVNFKPAFNLKGDEINVFLINVVYTSLGGFEPFPYDNYLIDIFDSFKVDG